MAGWFLFSALLSTYNKYVFGETHFHFPCPLLLTSIHFSVQWVFSEAMCGLFPLTFGADRIKAMTWEEWLAVSVPCGLVTSGDIGLSNLSLVLITLTFYTMVKSSTPVFVLVWAYLFGIERITWALVLVVVVIGAGEFLTVVGEVDFDLKGFALCLSASMLSGARWTLVQLKIQSLDPPLKTTITTMKILAPSMFFSILVLSAAIERPWNRFDGWTGAQVPGIVGLGLLGGFLAVAMVLCEFHLIMHASAMVLMIGGVIKEVITIFVGVMFFKDDLNRINLAGCFVVFCGVVLYKVTHHMSKKHGPPSSDDMGMSLSERGWRAAGAYDHVEVADADSGDDVSADLYPEEDANSNSSIRGLQLSDKVEHLEQRRPIIHSSNGNAGVATSPGAADNGLAANRGTMA